MKRGNVDGAKYLLHATSLFGGGFTDVDDGKIECMGDRDDDDDDNDTMVDEMMDEMEGGIMGVLWSLSGDVWWCRMKMGILRRAGSVQGKEVCWKKSHSTTLKGGLYCTVKPHP